MRVRFIVGCASIFLLGQTALGFEHTKTVPQGVRSLSVRSVTLSLSQRTSSSGELLPLGSRLEKALSFADMTKQKEGLERSLFKGLMLSEGLEPDDIYGYTTADLKGRAQVFAPILSYGLTDRLTLALALPIYKAKMLVRFGFKSTALGDSFRDRLGNVHNLVSSAREAADVSQKFYDKLAKNGYAPLQDWSGQGIGDLALVTKYKTFDTDYFDSSLSFGVTLPTGRKDDPDNLLDIPFGEGTWTTFIQPAFDQFVRSDLFFTESAKFTYFAPSFADTRLKTADEPIEVAKENIKSKKGSTLETGISLQYEPDFGLIAGLGFTHYEKWEDHYFATNNAAANEELAKNSREKANHMEFKLGYSAVPAFKRGSIKVPFALTVDYKKHLSSMNSFKKEAHDLITAEVSVFF